MNTLEKEREGIQASTLVKTSELVESIQYGLPVPRIQGGSGTNSGVFKQLVDDRIPDISLVDTLHEVIETKNPKNIIQALRLALELKGHIDKKGDTHNTLNISGNIDNDRLNLVAHELAKTILQRQLEGGGV